MLVPLNRSLLVCYPAALPFAPRHPLLPLGRSASWYRAIVIAPLALTKVTDNTQLFDMWISKLVDDYVRLLIHSRALPIYSSQNSTFAKEAA